RSHPAIHRGGASQMQALNAKERTKGNSHFHEFEVSLPPALAWEMTPAAADSRTAFLLKARRRPARTSRRIVASPHCARFAASAIFNHVGKTGALGCGCTGLNCVCG